MFKKVLAFNEFKIFEILRNRSIKNFRYKCLEKYIATSYKKKDLSKIDKKIKFKSTLSSDSINTKNEKTLNNLNSNLYLQIFSCLEKLNAWDENESDKKEKINELLKNNNLNLQINDEEMIKLISFKSEDKTKDSNENEINDEKMSHFLNNLETIISEEFSEEEYAEDNETNIRFIRPPQNKEELKKVFIQAEKIYEDNKSVLFHNDNTIKNEIKEKFVNKIPNYFLMRSLEYTPTGTEILVVGAQRNSNEHSLFISNILENFQPDMIAIQMAPDNPLFINCNNDYNREWKSYVKKKINYDFLINPLPMSVNDIIMTPKKIEKMIDETFAMSDDISISPKIVFSAQNAINIRNRKTIHPDSLLTPFIYSFNSKVDNFCPIAICDYPILRLLEDIVYSTRIDDLKEAFSKILDETTLNNYFFSIESFKKEIFLNGNTKRMDYLSEVLRHLSHSSKKIILVTNYHYVDSITDSWKNLDKEVKSLNHFYRDNKEQIYFVDFIEKLVLVDLMTGSFIHNNFIENETFPYQCRKIESWIASWMNVLGVWKHYHDHYSELISNVPFNQDLYNQFLEKFNLGFENEIDEMEEERKLKEQLFYDINNPK